MTIKGVAAHRLIESGAVGSRRQISMDGLTVQHLELPLESPLSRNSNLRFSLSPRITK
jgi:hypothetical protein